MAFSCRTLVPLIIAATALGSVAQDIHVADKLADWKFGKFIQGDPVTAKDLAGKVVVIEYWGTQ